MPHLAGVVRVGVLLLVLGEIHDSLSSQECIFVVPWGQAKKEREKRVSLRAS